MARTAHHLPPAQSAKEPGCSPGSPWHSAVLDDLRYSARSFADAEHEATRPRPHLIHRKVEVYRFARHSRDRSVARWSAVEERRARQQLRTQVTALRRLVNAAAGRLRPGAADAVDIPPAHHRHGSLWLA